MYLPYVIFENLFDKALAGIKRNTINCHYGALREYIMLWYCNETKELPGEFEVDEIYFGV